jgi:hypothetical protein
MGKYSWILIVHLAEEKCLAEDERKADDELRRMRDQNLLQELKDFTEVA